MGRRVNQREAGDLTVTNHEGQEAVQAGEVLPSLLAGMPPRLRLVASGPPGEVLARRDALDRAADAAADAQRRQAQAAFRERAWTASCPPAYRDASLARLMPQQDRDGYVSRWLASGTPMLLLHGPSRTGKTFAAWAVAGAARDSGLWVAGWRVTELLWQLRPSDDSVRAERARYAIATADLVVLDDLGRERRTDWTVEQVWDALETRLSAGLRTIVTTNLTPPAIRDGYGDPVMYRLTETGTAIPVNGRVLRPDDPT